MINNEILRIGLPEIGKIKIGMKGEKRKSRGGADFQLPTKLDHFIVTTLDKDNTGNFTRDKHLHKVLGENPKEIPIRLMFNDIEANFQTRLACYSGKNLFCSGDGVTAQQATYSEKGWDFKNKHEVKCPCERLDPGYQGKVKCKPSGRLVCLVDGAGSVGGAWVFRTTSWNTIQSITGSLMFIKQVANGELAGIPLKLTLQPKQVMTPEGKPMTAQIVSIQFKGDVGELRKISLQNARDRVEAKINMDHIQQKMLEDLTEEDVTPTDPDYVEEFHPEAQGEPEVAEEVTETEALNEPEDEVKKEAPVIKNPAKKAKPEEVPNEVVSKGSESAPAGGASKPDGGAPKPKQQPPDPQPQQEKTRPFEDPNENFGFPDD